ncbi:hypothetical protein DL546_001552 [Coniochaeta pulveracea]|uniref:Uncharacterized protein n=1 Tax=Coniochaeta pulveracea TaxID=177199 RepID=A0A420Y428_9PEZI|nr:hypothetical protein DL546_001552 [Coniochaeta pulveracea]
MLFIVSEKVPDGADMANEFASIIERCQTRHTDNILSFVEDPDHIHTAHADLLDKATDNVKHGWTKHDLAIVLEHKYWSSHKEDNNENEIAGVARAEQTTTDTFRQLEVMPNLSILWRNKKKEEEKKEEEKKEEEKKEEEKKEEEKKEEEKKEEE